MILIPRIGSLGAAVGTALSYLLAQFLYFHDQHCTLDVGARRIWILWTCGLVVGLSQFAVGSDPLVRLVWAVITTARLVSAVRNGRCADPLFVRLVLGAYPSIGMLATRMLVPAKT